MTAAPSQRRFANDRNRNPRCDLVRLDRNGVGQGSGEGSITRSSLPSQPSDWPAARSVASIASATAGLTNTSATSPRAEVRRRISPVGVAPTAIDATLSICISGPDGRCAGCMRDMSDRQVRRSAREKARLRRFMLSPSFASWRGAVPPQVDSIRLPSAFQLLNPKKVAK